jgi:hypothetical protein
LTSDPAANVGGGGSSETVTPMVRDRSAFLDALKARLDQARTQGERPIEDATPPDGAEAPPADDLWEPEAGETVAVDDATGSEDRDATLGPGPDASPRRLAEARFRARLWEPRPTAGDGDTTARENQAAGTDRRPAPDPQARPRSYPDDRRSSTADQPPSSPERVAAPPGGGSDRPEPARPWSESGMPQRMREAIASVRRMSIGGSPDSRDREPRPFGLREAPAPFSPRAAAESGSPREMPEAPGPFGRREAVEPFSPREAPEPPAPRDPPAPFSPRATPEPPDPSDAPGPFGPREAPEPFDRWESSEPFGSRDTVESLDRWDAPEPLDRWAPPEPLDREIPEQLAPRETPEQAASWQVSDDEPPAGIPAAGGRGIRIAAVVVAAAVVLLVGSGLGMMLAGWQIGLPSLPTGQTAPPPAAESEAAPTAPRAPPAITETLRVERPATPPAPAADHPPADLNATGAPLPPPPKPAPSAVPREASPTTEPADQAVETLLREAGGPGAPLKAPIEGAGPLSAARVFVRYTAGAAAAPATAGHLVRHLKAAGFAAEAQEVDYPIESDSIRYFFAADRDQAEALRSSLEGQVPGGAAPPVVDFTRDDPKPEDGHLELWIGA